MKRLCPNLTILKTCMCAADGYSACCGNSEDIRWVFAEGYKLYCKLKQQRPDIDILSMGMTHDYETAIEEGANMVRIGTALFGQRDYSLKF